MNVLGVRVMNNQMHGFAADDRPLHPEMDFSRSAGAANLIESCIGDVDGMKVLLVCEDPKHGWYDSAAPDLVHRELTARGAIVTKMIVDLPENQPNAGVQAAMDQSDRVIFFSRLGDQGRFNWHYTGPNCVMSYALNRGMLDGGFGSLDHLSMCQLKAAIDAVTLSANHIQVTCPLGTHFEGSPGATAIRGATSLMYEKPRVWLPVPKMVMGSPCMIWFMKIPIADDGGGRRKAQTCEWVRTR